MRYEFDAADIPAEGYDAQCSNCSSVFFVAPEGPVAAASENFGVTQADASIVPQVSVQIAIACPQCGAVYQFDSLDVPEAGYDAQCTQCESIFLVAPHTVAPYEAAPAAPAPVGADDETSFASVNELLGQAETSPQQGGHAAASMAGHTHAGDVDRTHATPRPQAEGSDSSLEPTRPGFSPQLLDGGTFERTDPTLRVPQGYAGHVAAHTVVQDAPFADDTRPGEPGASAHEVRAAVASGVPTDHHRSPEPQVPKPSTLENETEQPPARPPVQTSAWANAAEQAEHLSAPPTNPVMALPGPGVLSGERLPTGVLPPDESGESQRLRTAPMQDAAAARRARRSQPDASPPPGRALRIVLVALAVLLGGLWVVAEKRPELIAQVLQNKPQSHAVAIEAQALCDQGKKALLRDTDVDYEAAIDTFGKALQHDAQYAEAQAWQVVAHSLRGADLRREGARLYADWEQEQALGRGLKALERQGVTLSPEQAAQSAQLEEQGPKHLQAATETLERGGKELSVAQVQAQRARAMLPRSAPIAAAAALCYTQTPSDMAVAQSLLGQYSGLAASDGDAAPSKQSAAPADIWLLLAQGRVAATQEKTREDARAAFTQALQVEPSLVRALWELAQLDVEAGQVDDAKKRYQDILSAVSNHPKAMAALAALEHPHPAASASPGPSAAGAAAPDLDTIAPAAGGDTPDSDTPQVPKRLRHRRRAVPAAPAAPGEPSAPEPAPPGSE